MVTIKYVNDWNEFQVSLKGNPDTTYHTDCPVDARDTARAMSVSNRCAMTVHRSAQSHIKRVEALPSFG